MGRLNSIITALVLPWLTFVPLATAQPTIDSIKVQGYMKRANGTAVTNGSYTMAFGVFQNGVAIWGRSYSVTVTNGLFAQTLSGVGGDLSALPAGTSMNSNFTSVTLNPALLMSAASGDVTVRVYAVSAIDGANPQFDITYGSVPTAFVAETAKGVANQSVTLSGIATTAMTAASSGAGDAGKLVRLDSAGQIDVSMIPSLPASQISSGSVGVSYGGTGATTAAGARSNLGAAASGVNSDITELTGITVPLTVAQGGTGGGTPAAARASLGAAASGVNSDITELTGITVPLSLNQGGTNASLTAVNGGVVYSTGSAMAISAAGSSGQILKSNGAAAPTWSSLDALIAPRRIFYTSVQSNATATTGVTNVGWATAPTVTCTTAAAGTTNAYPGLSCSTNATAGTVVGFANSAANSAMRIGFNPDMVANLATAAGISNQRIWVGFGNTINFTTCGTGLACQSTSPSAQHVAAFRYVAGTDTSWQCVTCDGTACTTTNSSVAVASSTFYSLRVALTSSSATFFINGSQVCSHSTNLPGAATALSMGAQLTNTTGAVQGFVLSGVFVQSR